MKRSSLTILSLFFVTAMVFVVAFSCRKSETPPDPNLSIVVKRQLVISAVNPVSNDSIGQFSATIVSPTSTTTQVATGNTIVINNPVGGTYTITVTKTGFVDPPVKTVVVTLPSDAKSNLTVLATVEMTKSAPAVVATAATGVTIPVKSNAEVQSSPVVATVTVPPATVYTMPDGSKPTTVSMSVTNVPVATQVAPVLNVGGTNQVQLTAPVEIVNNQIPSSKIDLQPAGLTFSNPVTVDVYIGNSYPAKMSLAEKTARQAGLTMSYVRKDGTVEVVAADHFSADRNTVYYKVTHFDKWIQSNKLVTLTPKKAATLSPVQTFMGNCGANATYTFTYKSQYTGMAAWLLTGVDANASFSVTGTVNATAQPGYQAVLTWQAGGETQTLTDSTPGYTATYDVTTPNQLTIPGVGYITCHNQGGN